MICLACGAAGHDRTAAVLSGAYAARSSWADTPDDALYAVSVAGGSADAERVGVLCLRCWRSLSSRPPGDEPELRWLTPADWGRLAPITPFADLPLLDFRRPDGSVGAFIAPGDVSVYTIAHYFTPLVRYHMPGGLAE